MKQKIIEILEDMDTAKIVQIHNEYCEAANYMNDYIFGMEMFDEMERNRTPTEIAEDVSGDFNINDKYFYYDGYANLHSFTYWEVDKIIYPSEIAQYIIDNEETFGNYEIEEILEGD